MTYSSEVYDFKNFKKMASNHKLSGAQNRKRKNKIFNENKQGAKFMRGFLSQNLEIETDRNSPK